jgi:hypothetical protein
MPMYESKIQRVYLYRVLYVLFAVAIGLIVLVWYWS